MYEYIKGILTEISPAEAIVEACGVGWKLAISLTTFSPLQSLAGQEVKLFTHHHLREDDEQLFGFFTKDERAVFQQLISVSGIGAGSARMILSSMTADETRSAILGGDTGRFKAVKGIGLKSAQRIILELKDKIDKTAVGDLPVMAAVGGDSAVREEARSALVLLGFSRPAVEKVLSAILQQTPDITIEALIKKALKML
ncbi:MAG: Holliday junction branch migration protein RuvA [Bacteroidales bacterium]|nr:Holliday junction branch migration protein RuvA [Candidatus Cacconaster equifaecalis]